MFRKGEGQKACRACTSRVRMKTYVKSEEGSKHLKHMTARAAQVSQKSKEWHRVYRTCNGAKHRCKTNEDYAGRGIEFRFESPAAMARWVIENLGYPEKHHSIDRINNDGHYEAGNLRWATVEEQANNKREYKGFRYGERIRKLMQRTEYGYESIRTFINEGMTDEQIISRAKHPSGRPRLRHCKLRAKK
jgi:hypothetical protein